MSSAGHEWAPHEREGWSVCSRCGMVRNYNRETTTCSGALPKIRQRNSMEADERLRVVRRLLEENGCDCPCDHHADERGPDCEVCLACRIGEAVGR